MRAGTLGENCCIAAIPGRGCQFVAPVGKISPESQIVEQISVTNIFIEETIFDEPQEKLITRTDEY